MICKYLEIIFNIHKIGEDELIMKRFNRNTGITLIALVITIVLNSSYLAMGQMNKFEKI